MLVMSPLIRPTPTLLLSPISLMIRLHFSRAIWLVYKTQSICITSLWNSNCLSSSQSQVRFSSELPLTFQASQDFPTPLSFCFLSLNHPLLSSCTSDPIWGHQQAITLHIKVPNLFQFPLGIVRRGS